MEKNGNLADFGRYLQNKRDKRLEHTTTNKRLPWLQEIIDSEDV